MHSISRQAAKTELASRRRQSAVVSLTPEVCWLVVIAGGPTFGKRSRQGFRCHQTGHLVKSRQTQGFSARIFSLARETQSEKETAAARLPVVGQSLLGVYVDPRSPEMRCPWCSERRSNSHEGEARCLYCTKGFRVIFPKNEDNLPKRALQALQPASSSDRQTAVYDETNCEVRCPWCHTQNYGVYIRGAKTCQRCSRKFEAI